MIFWWILLAWCAISIVLSPLIGRFIERGYGDDDDEREWWDL